MTNRYVRHFGLFYITPFDNESLRQIFNNVVRWCFVTNDINMDLQKLSPKLVQSTIEIYNEVASKLRPTPAKLHYTYNMRDVSKVFQGISLGDKVGITTNTMLIKLWMHECIRVFCDRLINTDDISTFYGLLDTTLDK